MKKYTNRYGDEFTFELNENGNIQWSGDFKHTRFGWKESEDNMTFVDPSGGPFISVGLDMGLYGLDGMTVAGFANNENGYEIIVKK
jgi:hypothetical protein